MVLKQLYSFQGLLLYIRDILKITKLTNINCSTIEKHIEIKTEQGAAATRTPHHH